MPPVKRSCAIFRPAVNLTACNNWIVCHEPVKTGLRGYFAELMIVKDTHKPRVEGQYLALIEAGGLPPFDGVVRCSLFLGQYLALFKL